MFTSEQINQASGIPVANIDVNWPTIYQLMVDAGHSTDLEQVGMIATICVETNIWENHKNCGFCPINELGGYNYFEEHYGYQTECGKNLGNTSNGDGAKYHGRGFIQTTGKDNYNRLGIYLGINLLVDPDQLLLIDNASKAAIKFFNDTKHNGQNIWYYCVNTDLERIRRMVNGGVNGLETFEKVANNLIAMIGK